MRNVVLLSGKAQSGKNQFADFLKEEFRSRNLVTHNDLFAYDVKEGSKEDFRAVADAMNTQVQAVRGLANSLFSNHVSSNGGGILFELNRELDKLQIFDHNYFEDKTPVTRALLQVYGTNIFRNRVDQNYWTKKLRDRVMSNDNVDVFLITDTRFPNEIEIFSEDVNYNNDVKVISIRINRYGLATMSHESETSLDDWENWDYIVENNSSLEDLRDSANTIVNDLLNSSQED